MRPAWTRVVAPAPSASKFKSLRVQKLNFFLSCCTNCTATCVPCPLGKKLDADQMVKAILGLGGEERGRAGGIDQGQEGGWASGQGGGAGSAGE